MSLRVGGVRIIPNTDGSQVNSLDLASKTNAHAVKVKAPDTVSADVSFTLPGVLASVYGFLVDVLGNGILSWLSFGAGVVTFLVTPSSANLAAALTDETGTGAAVFANSPTLSGNPTAPTPSPGDNDTSIATTAFVTAAVAAGVGSSALYLVKSYLIGKPDAGLIVLADDVPSNMSTVTYPGNFANSVGKCGTNPASTATYTIKQNGSSIGTMVISTGGAFSFTTTSGTAKAFAASDELTVEAPAVQDATLSDVRFTLAGTR